MYTAAQLLHLKKTNAGFVYRELLRKLHPGLFVALEAPPRGGLFRSTGFVIVRMTQ